MSELERRLHEATPRDPGAEERAWRLAHAAFVRRPAVRSRGRGRLALVAVAAAAMTLAAAVTSAGSGVVGLVLDHPAHGPARHAGHAAPRAVVPGGGRLLAVRGGWAELRAGGAPPRRLAPADAATFSAFGHYVAVADGRRLTVVALDGRRVWSLSASQPIHGVRWAPDGLRIAYRAGWSLHVVDGNGERPRTLGAAAGGAPAWRPGPEAVLAHLRAPRVLALTDVATGRDVAVVRPPARLRALTWSADGRRLLALGARRLRVFGPGGALLRRRVAAPGTTLVGAAYAPRGRRLALVSRRGGLERLRVDGRTLARGPRLGPPLWSPDGRRILVGARAPSRSTVVDVAGRPTPRSTEIAASGVVGWTGAGR